MGRGAVAPSHGRHLGWEGRADAAGTAGIHTGTAPTCRSQGSSNTCPVLLLIPVIPMALAAGWQEEPTLLQSVPTAPSGDGPSHGRSHDWACRRRHGQGIPPGRAAVWAGGEEPQIPAGRGATDPSWKRSCRSQWADAALWRHRCQSGHGVMRNAPPAQARKHQFALENKDLPDGLLLLLCERVKLGDLEERN